LSRVDLGSYGGLNGCLLIGTQHHNHILQCGLPRGRHYGPDIGGRQRERQKDRTIPNPDRRPAPSPPSARYGGSASTLTLRAFPPLLPFPFLHLAFWLLLSFARAALGEMGSVVPCRICFGAKERDGLP
jgi:hypothetical protein